MITTIDEQREDRLVAVLSHASLLVFFFGALVPLVAWFTQKDRSSYLRFQALQALIYQAIGIIAYFLTTFLAFLLMAVMMLITALAAREPAGSTMEDPVTAIMVLFFLALICLFPLLNIASIFYFLLGVWASIRVVRGHPFRYPILGRLLEKALNRAPVAPVTSAT